MFAIMILMIKPFIIINGYVYLDGKDRAGLGKYLYDELSIKKPIIGIAKTYFYGITPEYAVYRGMSKHPLYVTTIDFDGNIAKELVQGLQGKHRIPDIIKAVDKLSRSFY